jgi:D-amino peptidase
MAEYWARNVAWDNPRRQEYRELLTRDCNAAIEGCYRAGAEEVIVSDDGMGGLLAIPEMMDARARWLRGPGFGGATPLLQGADGTFLGVLLIGAHAMQDAPNGLLAHTWSSKLKRRSWVNGEPFGELFEYAVAAGHDHQLPILLVHGDHAVCNEATQLLGSGVTTVSVKQGLGDEQRAIVFAPSRARQLLADGAAQAVAAALKGQVSSRF